MRVLRNGAKVGFGARRRSLNGDEQVVVNLWGNSKYKQVSTCVACYPPGGGLPYET